MRNKKILGLCVGLLVLIAIGATWFWYSRNASELKADSSSEVAFELINAADRSLDGSPALALTFSQPLNTRESYGDYIQVFEMPSTGKAVVKRDRDDYDEDEESESVTDAQASVSTNPQDTQIDDGKEIKGAWVVGDNPHLLYFPNIKPQTRYVVYIKPNVVAANNKTLGKEYRYSIVTAAMSPAFYFASNGMVLPAQQNGGLPVVTVNIPEVNVEFLRVREDQLPRFLNMVISGKKDVRPPQNDEEEDDDRSYSQEEKSLHGSTSGWELDSLHKLADSVYQNRFTTEEQKNKRSVTFLPVEQVKELKEPGIYVAVMSQPGRFRYDYQVTYFYVSDMGLTTRLYQSGAEALVSSLTDGKAISGVSVSWIDKEGKVLAKESTDGDGRASFETTPEEAKVLIARKGSQISMIALKEPALDLSEYDIGGNTYQATRLFAYTGRDLYRPGEAFEVSVLARDADGRAVAALPIQATLRRPDGHNQLVATWKPDAKHPGYYRQRVDIPMDAPTGKWALELRSDPASKQAEVFKFAVEEFMPERMKLDLTSEQETLDVNAEFTVDIKGTYLYGAPAQGNKLLGIAEFSRNKNPLQKQLPGFTFGNDDDDKLAKRTELEETKLEADGTTSISIETGKNKGLRSPMLIRGTFSLLESGGRPVIRSIERTIWPTEQIIGVRPKFAGAYAKDNSLAEFEVVRANKKGQITAAKGLQARLFRENRDYYWRFDDQRGWNSGYTETSELVGSYTIDVPDNGRGQLKLPVKYGRYRIEITDPQSQALVSYRFYAGWNAEQNESDGIRPDRVTLSLDKAFYKEGDTAELTIVSPHKGQAMVSVEGDKMLWFKRVSITSEKQTLSIPINKKWLRHDMYVAVTVLRPGNEGDLVTPARALGIAHIGLDREDRKLGVTLTAPEKSLPDTTVKVKVSVAQAKGQSAMVTLSAVDVGILNITNFVSPDPHKFFFGQLRYNVDIHDIYGRLIEKMAGKKGKLKFGGDTSMKPTQSMPQKVKLVDLFSGPVALDANGEAQISLPLPDFNGKLRLMAVVSTPEQFGSAEKEMTVAAPLIAEIATPRFLGLGDHSVIALDLHNMSGTTQQLKVKASASAGLTLENGERSVRLKNQEKTTLRFTLTAAGVPNLADLRVQVTGQGIALDRHFPLQTEAPTAPQTINNLLVIEPGQSVTLKAPPEASGWYEGTQTVQMLISNKAPLDIRPLVKGLLTYPYGCTEQTTSSSYPHIFIDEETARRYGMKAFTREERMSMLSKSIAKLGAMQAPNGGFSLWGDASTYEYWLSAYVTQFLQDARANSFEVPEQMYNKATGFLLRELSTGIASLPRAPVQTSGRINWSDTWGRRNNNFGVLTYGAYVLAQDKKAPLSSLRQLFDLRANAKTGLSLVQLGVALHLAGDETRAKTALAEGVVKARDNNTGWYDYGSDLRDSALSYALIQKHKLTVQNAGTLIGRLAQMVKEKQYLSTQEQLALFLAARGLESSSSEQWNATLATNKDTKTLNGQGHLYSSVTYAEIAGGAQLTNNTGAQLFVQTTSTGYPKQAPAEGGKISLTRSYYSADGKPLTKRALRVGETIWVKVSASSSYDAATTMIVDRIPAGLEIENTNLIQGESGSTLTIDGQSPAEAMSDSRITHTEFRDDRFVAAVRLGSWWNDKVTLFYRVRVVTPGRFIIPPLSAEDMYNPGVRGSTGGTELLTITNAQGSMPDLPVEPEPVPPPLVNQNASALGTQSTPVPAAGVKTEGTDK